LITGLILLACAVVGLETHEPFARQYDHLFALVNTLILVLFVLEMALRVAADGRRFFSDGWNWFDLMVVSICLLPTVGQYVLLFRLFRAVRAIRLVEAFSRLRVVVATLLDSLPSIGYVLLLMFIHLYVYGVIGYFLFHHNDPLHFRNLPTALLALFQVATLEGWAEIFYINYYGCASTYTLLGQGWCVASQAQPLIATVDAVQAANSGHPEYRWTSGIETTTGPLGQGVATSVGMALAGSTDYDWPMGNLVRKVRGCNGHSGPALVSKVPTTPTRSMWTT